MRRLAAVVLSAGLLLTATSCNMIVKNDEEQFDYPVTIGNTVITQAPKNIAVLSENLADVVLACGYEGKIAARSDECTQEALAIIDSVGTPDCPDVSELENLDVDLVLADKTLDEETSEKLAKDGVNVLIMKPATDTESLGKLYNNVAAAMAGSYTGKMNAMSVFDELRNALDSIKNNASRGSVITTVCYIYDLTADECVVAYGEDFADQLFNYTALTNIAAADDDGVIGIDTLLKGNPDVIFCDTGVYDKLSSHKDLKSLKALTKGTAYELPRKYLELQGATCIRTADFMAAKSHNDYTQTQEWPVEVAEKKEEYHAPFEPQIEIYYTVGETYEPIRYIEERLIGLGYMQGEADETFTEETEEAISSFQAVNQMSITGIADYATLKVLLSSRAISKADAGTVEFSAD